MGKLGRQFNFSERIQTALNYRLLSMLALLVLAVAVPAGDVSGKTPLPVAGARLLQASSPDRAPEAALLPAANTLFGLETVDDSLWTIDRATGNGQVVGATGVSDLSGLACSDTPDLLYAVDDPDSSSRLFTIDAATGEATPVGDTGFHSIKGLAYDEAGGILYGLTYLNELVGINPETGAAALIGEPGSSFLDSLAYHPGQNALFAANIDSDTLYRIDPETGAGEEVGAIGFDNVSGLSYDAEDGILYGAARANGQLIAIDVATGAGVSLGSMPNTAFQGLAGCMAVSTPTPTPTPTFTPTATSTATAPPPPPICRESQEFVAIADASVREADPGTRLGDRPTLQLGWRAEDDRLRTYATFDISTLPGNAVIDRAELVMFQRSAAAGNREQFFTAVHHVLQPWQESTIVWANQPAFVGTPGATAQHLIGRGWRQWPLTSLVRQLHQEQQLEVRLMVAPPIETQDFLLSEYASKELSRDVAPRLCIEWDYPTATPTSTSTPTTTPTPTPTATSRPDLVLEQIEITQGIQNFAHDVSLTTGKRTYVRLYAAAYRNGASIGQMNVRAVLHGFDNSGSNTGAPLPHSPLPPLNGRLNIRSSGWDRGDTATSFQFVLPTSWTTTGQIMLQAELNPSGAIQEANRQNNSIVRVIDFNSEKRVCLVLIPVRTQSGTASWNRSTLHDIGSRAESMIPARGLVFFERTGHPLEEGKLNKSPFESNDGSKILDKLWWRGPGQPGSQPKYCRQRGLQTHYVGVVPDNSMGSTAGKGRRPGKLLWFELDTGRGIRLNGQNVNEPEAGITLAHELGHNFDRKHAPCGNPKDVGPYPYPTCQIDTAGQNKHYGYDRRTDTALPPDKVGDLMSYADTTGIPIWPSDFTWENMRDEINDLSTDASPAATQNGGDVVLAAGLIEEGTNIPVVRWQRHAGDYLAAERLAELAPVEGPYQLRLLDGGGEVLASHAFTATPILDGEGSALFTLAVPYQQGTAEIEILRAETALAGSEVSPSPPELRLISPNGGETFSGSLEVTWEGSDADGDALLYDVYYSHDEGESWLALASETGDTSLNVDATALPGSEGQSLVRVVAGDGFHTALDESDAPFSLSKKPPQASILAPDNEATYALDQPIILRGEGYDPEDGPLAGEALQWQIEGWGEMGSGEEVLDLRPDLGAGCHEVTLTVRDSDGQSDTAATPLCIDAQLPSFPTYMPLLIRLD